MEHVKCVIADVLRAFAGDSGNNCQEFVPLAEFAINDSVSPLGSGYTPFYADSGQHPRRPLTPPDAPDPAVPAGSGEAAAHMMVRVTAEVQALLQERQDPCKAALGAHWRDVKFAVGAKVRCFLTQSARPSPRGRCFLCWMGPFTVLARTVPNTHHLDFPTAWRVVLCAEVVCTSIWTHARTDEHTNTRTHT